MTAHQIDLAITASIAISALTVFFLMLHLLTRKTSTNAFYSDSYKAALAIEADVKAFKTARPASMQMAIDAVNKSRTAIAKVSGEAA